MLCMLYSFVMGVRKHNERKAVPGTPASLGLAGYRRWRPGQRELLEQLLALPHRFVFLEAPTGSGKSLLGVAAARLMEARLLYVVHTRQLQEQLAADFPVAVIMGRGNYPTANRSSLSCEACELRPGKRHCPHCCSPRLACRGETPACDAPSRCPYLGARRRAEQAEMTVANAAYLLHDLDGAGALVEDRQLLVVDEADELPGAIVQHLTLELSQEDLRMLALRAPAEAGDAAAWRPWAREAVQAATEALAEEEKALATVDDPLARGEIWQRLRRLEFLLPRLKRLAQEDEIPWVVVSREEGWQLRPLHSGPYASFLLWSRVEGRVLLMSATIADARLLARELGIPRDAWAFISAPSPIPPDRRRVLYIPVAPLSHANAERTWPLMVEAMDSILDAHPRDRGIVHTHSYRLAAHVLAHSRHRQRLVGHEGAGDRSRALHRHRQTENAVLVSPSMERGVDFAGDRARFAVLLKTPYPNLGDPRVAARLASPGGQEWYARETVRAIVQACGRVCRGPSDYGVTCILDASFGRLLRGYARLFPQWFLDALRVASHDGGGRMTATALSTTRGGAQPWA